MTCQEVLNHLPAHQDGDLPRAEAEAVQQHLATCDACAAELVLMDKAWAMLDAFPTVEVASDFNHRFWKKVEAEPVTWWQRVRHTLASVTRAPVRSLAVFAVMMILVGLGMHSIVSRQIKEEVPVPVVQVQEEDTAHYNVLGDVADLAPDMDDDQTTPQPAATTDQKIDQILEELPLDSGGPQG